MMVTVTVPVGPVTLTTMMASPPPPPPGRRNHDAATEKEDRHEKRDEPANTHVGLPLQSAVSLDAAPTRFFTPTSPAPRVKMSYRRASAGPVRPA